MLIQIKSYQFELSEPYSEGHPLTASEARALNALRAENIRNTAAKWIQREQDKSGEALLPAETLKTITHKLTEYDSSYSFKTNSIPSPSLKPGTLASIIRTVATERVEAQIRGQSEIPSPDAYADAIRAMESLPETITEARRRLEARQSTATTAIEDLL